ncbi:insulin receptor substrate 1-B-like [Megalops cyprinoides]|uniref:insulin receptor substrate 1-B-like n=1 Tax=Megalops cyprinoides TaxID=118141 RepID=UPI001864E154|nr:insulin receptor substrate 1-B-like [Megalops cyprinoides]
MASPAADQAFSDVRKVGYLRKPKSMHKRFFVLRIASGSGPSRLEYYENEKKWRHKSGAPKRTIPLESCFNINKRADSKNKYLVALYTKEEYFAVAADSEQEQDLWYQALVDLHNRGKLHEPARGNGIGEDSYGEATPGPAFKEVWQVSLKPKGLGQTKNLTGIYRLCLTNKTISFVKLNSDAAAVVLQLMNIRRCGHSENFFFIEVGRSSVTGPGEFWMQVDDSVVAQNMHETLLEAMKAMSEEFHPRSKSQSSSKCSTPISVPLRRHHHNHPPPSQVGLGRRSRAESVTATSPTAPGKQNHSFRVRASSDGEGTMSRPASVGESPSSPSSARTHCPQQRGGSRLHPPLSHSRSIPVSSTRCSPSATSPISLSSSSTSGHGSTSDCLYPRRSSVSASGSPSDGGFISSDEYGSSPCDFRSPFRSATPDSLGHTPPAREEELNNYMCMAKPGLVPNRHCGHPSSRCTPPRLEELEKSFRKRTHSSGASPPTICHQKTPSQSSTASMEEYAQMVPTYLCGRASSYRHSPFLPVHSYPEESLDQHLEGRGTGLADDGYMPMSPGVAPLACKRDDYMLMSPKSMSEPQQILSPRTHCQVDSSGYMMMSPSVSCSPENANYAKVWNNGANPALSESSEGKGSCGDYINMSPASCSATSSPPDCYFNPVEEPPKPIDSYYSLPRSFRHAHRKQERSPLRVVLSSGRLAYGDSSTSTSSDSLGPHDSEQLVVRSKEAEAGDVGAGGKLNRPTRLSLDSSRASTLPRTRDSPFPLRPPSPGEYVNMEFSDRPFSAHLPSLLEPAFAETSAETRTRCSSDYMTMEMEAQGNKPRKQPATCGVLQLGRACSGYRGKDFLSEIEPSAEPLLRSISPVQGIVPGTGPGLSAFSRVHSSPSQNQGARVIRADLQGRRRHSSETFRPAAEEAVTTPCTDDVKRHSAILFESARPTPGEPARCGTGAPAAGTDPTFSTNGLNYMDLNLGKILNQPEWSFLRPKASQPSSAIPLEEVSAYASVSFQKPEHTGSDPADREE